MSTIYKRIAACVLFFAMFTCATRSQELPTSTNDPYLWLEDVTGARALDWVKGQNALSTRELQASPRFEPLRRRLLSIYDSKEKIPYVAKHGPFYYNFWRDEKNARGVWRRTTLAEYKKADPAWEVVLDLDKLALHESENWVWKGYAPLYPTYDRCLIFLSRGGADASVAREFDLKSKEFVTNGFYLPEAKTDVVWRDRDTLYVGTDFGPGSRTDSGYPRVIKEWKRGTPLAQARTVFEGKTQDVEVHASVVHDHGHTYEFASRAVTFFSNETFLRQGDQWVKLDKPDDAEVSTFDDQLLLRLRSDWFAGGKSYQAGALVSANFEAYLKGERALATVFEPTERKSLQDTSSTLHYLIVNELENVRNKLFALKRENGRWVRAPLEAPAMGSVEAQGIDPDESDDYFLTVTDFLTPSSLYIGTLGQAGREKLKSLPAFFKTDGLQIHQYEAVSKDGTRIPYFQVSRQGLAADGQNPTLLYGYGGFEISMRPATTPRRAPPGWSRAGFTCWPIFAAAASLAPNGTRPLASRTASAPTTTLSPWRRI